MHVMAGFVAFFGVVFVAVYFPLKYKLVRVVLQWIVVVIACIVAVVFVLFLLYLLVCDAHFHVSFCHLADVVDRRHGRNILEVLA